MRKVDNEFNGVVGVPDGPVDDEEDHFYQCHICGQMVDMRHLGEVVHHNQPDHERLKDD